MLVVERIKDILVGSLGIVGYIVWKLILFVFYFIPVLTLDIPWWASTLAVICIMEIPIVGNLLYFASWVWSFIVVISKPISGFSIFYFIVFGIYVLTGVLPFIINLIATLFDERE